MRTPRLYLAAEALATSKCTVHSMDPAHLEWMAQQVHKGRSHLCPNGSHLAIYDDQETYFASLIGFVEDVVAARF